MKRIIRILLLATIMLIASDYAYAQHVVGGEASYNFDYLTPKTYEIGGITFEGAESFDTRVVQLVAGLHVGDRIKLPGEKLSAAVDNLWNQGMFEDVQISVTRLHDGIVYLHIALKERPRLDKFAFRGAKKGEQDKLRKEMNIATGEVVTENLLRTSTNKVKGFYIDKGYTRVDVTPTTETDSTGRVTITYNINRGKKVKIDSLLIEGNKEVSDFELENQMEKTHDVNYTKKWYKPWRILTKAFWKKSRYIEADFQDDLDKIITYYNKEGYRDARIISDTVWTVPPEELHISNKKKAQQDRVKVQVKLYEGQKYHFRNITFSGNTVYPDDVLYRSLRIKKGDPYNRTVLEQNLSYNPSGTDITSLYTDNGYVFFRATPVEVAVEGDSIDIEIRIYEGKQARIRNVTVEGNTITNDNIIIRELHTRPGDLFSRDALIRSHRELTTLGYFKQESIKPEPHPYENEGVVDIVYKVEEGNTSTINLQGGYGSGMLILQAGLQLNNFSVRNIFNPEAWVPLPAGDGQKLALNIATNGNYYATVNASFTEPWLGGRRPQSLTVSAYHQLLTNGILFKPTEEGYQSIQITGLGVNFMRRLKWPDDFFFLSHGLTYRHYNLDNYSLYSGSTFTNGTSNELSYNLTLTRNSFDSPIYTRSGSEISISTSVTPPFSLMSGRDYSDATEQEKYLWSEYYKVNLQGSWMLNLVGDLVLSTRFRFGFMGYFNSSIGLTPFGRYELGGDGLRTWNLDGREIIPLRGYDQGKLSPQTGASVFDRYTFELRQPIIEGSSATIWVLGFLEGGNSWADLKEFQPFQMYNSAGVGVRLHLPFMGLIGIDWGYGFDGANGGSHFHVSIGQSLD